MDIRAVRILILSYLSYSFLRCNTLSIHRSTLAVVSINSLERDGLRQAEFCPCYIMDNRPNVVFLVHKDMGSAVLGCRPVSSRLISIRLRTAPFMSPSHRSMHQHLDMMTMKLTTSIGNSRKSLTKHLRRTFWLYKEIGMLKLGGMHRQTEETYVDPTAMLRQMREVSDF